MSGAREKAVVLLSGGLDSATCLAMAQADGLECHALSVDYGQRHRTELAAARRVADARGVSDHRVVRVDLTAIGGSALTDPAIAVPTVASEGIPVTYVPARNTIFLSLALGLAETLDARLLYVGANAVDYSGYPDCRPAFVQGFQALARVATRTGVEGAPWEVRAPLMDMTKADIIRTGVRLGIDYALTVSCYQADDAGRACGECDSCRIRREGFRAAGVPDPTSYRQ
ncbi:MAG: 7-cyano-7-deazaguanine synthase QueC [Pseudomonadota bacterium]